MLSSRDDTMSASRDNGFTLIELLISITILGIIMGAVSAAMLTGLRVNAATGTRIDESRDEQFIAAYFSADAQGAQTITPGGAAPAACNFPGGGGLPDTQLVVQFTGEDFDDAQATTTRTVSYVRRKVAGGTTSELHRLVCTGGATTPAAGGDTTLARNMDTAWSLTCLGAVPCSTGVSLALRSGTLQYTLVGYKRTT